MTHGDEVVFLPDTLKYGKGIIRRVQKDGLVIVRFGYDEKPCDRADLQLFSEYVAARDLEQQAA